MRTRSLVGPLILIGIGVIFLVHSLNPDTSLVGFLARYWPVVLMAWGGLRILEILLLAARRRPLPVSGVSGGEWALVFLLCLVGSGTYFAYERVDWQPLKIRMKGVELFGEPYDYIIKAQTISTGPAPFLVIENLRGNVRIKAADRMDVAISGRKTVRALDSDSASQTDRLTPLEWERQGSGFLIKTNHARAKGQEFVSTDLEIEVPREARIEARGRYGDWDIAAVQGAIVVVSDNAGVRIDDVAGPVKIDTRASDVIRVAGVKGTVELNGFGSDLELERIDGNVTVNASYSGEIQIRDLKSPIRYEGNQTELRAEAVPGILRMSRGDLNAEDITGPVVIDAKSKDVQITRFTQHLDLRLERGDVEVRPGQVPLPPMTVVTQTGHIELALPEDARFNLKGTARRGEVENDYDDDAFKIDDEGKGNRTTVVSVNGSGPEINLLTENGTIRLRRLDPAEVVRKPLPPRLPPPPPPPATGAPTARQLQL